MKRALMVIVSLIIVTQLGLQPTQAVQETASFNTQSLNSQEGLAAQPDAGLTSTATSGISDLYPGDLNPPESCGAPLRGPFGKDVEVFLGPWEGANGGYRLDQPPAWYDAEQIPDISSVSNIVAIPLSTERIAALWNESGTLYYNIWDASREDGDASPGGWNSSASPLTGITPEGNPVLISPAGNQIEIYARAGGKIYYGNEPVLGDRINVTWLEIEGITNAVSDPAVVMMDPSHKLVFYRDANDMVWFSEWVGAWRHEPILLTGMLTYTYLPLVRTAGAGGATSATRIFTSDQGRPDTFPITLASELSTISRNENHAAVFGVDEDGNLWVNEWTQQNASDWSDTHWFKLMAGVAVEKPAVASRHANQMAVAVRSTSGEPYYIEWTVAAGWKTPVALNNIFASPLLLSATSIEAMSVIGIGADGIAYEKVWDESGEWGTWVAITGNGIELNQTLAAAVRRMEDIMVLGQTSTGEGFYRHRTGQGRSLEESGIVPSGMKGYGRGQALPWVEGNALWLTAHEDQVGAFWNVEAYAINAPQVVDQTLYNHPYSTQDVISVAQGDLELDGSEEVALATHSPTSPWTHISLLDLTITPTLGISIRDTVEISDTLEDISVAIGDLDGDQTHNEVILGAIRADYIRLMMYEYITETLTLEYKNQLYVAYASTGSHEIELTTGYLDSDICGDRQSLIVLDTTKYYDGLLYHVDNRVGTYCLNPDTWDLDLEKNYHVEEFTQTAEPAWGSYHSAVSTGDMNVDGYDELVYSFADKLVFVDPYVYSSTITLEGYWPSRSLAMGDINRDGKAEVLLSEPASGSARIMLYEAKQGGGLLKTGDRTLPGSGLGTVLIGDLDNDTYVSELAGCATFHEPVVVAVVNGAPVWYTNDIPIQVTQGSYSKTSGGGSGSENGTSYNLGGSLTVGFNIDSRVPVAATKIWEVRGSLAVDFMHTQGHQDTTENIIVYGTGYGFDDGLGLVVYFDTIYACYYYDLYRPDYPEDKSRAMTCRPVAIDIQTKSSLEYWHSNDWKVMAGDSWVNVGHHSRYGQLTNDLGVMGNYPRELTLDPYSLVYRWTGAPLMVNYDPNQNLYVEWWVDDEDMRSEMDYTQREGNVTASAGFSVFGIGMDASFTAGLSSMHNSITTWTDTLSFGGRVYSFSEQRPCYGIVPYVYLATARTLAGTTYKYWEADYYVPWQGPCSLQNDISFPLVAMP